MIMNLQVPDIIGSIGVAMLLGGYALHLMGRLAADDIAYILLNTVGAGLAALASWLISYWPFVVLEGAWCLVSAAALYGVLFRADSK